MLLLTNTTYIQTNNGYGYSPHRSVQRTFSLQTQRWYWRYVYDVRHTVNCDWATLEKHCWFWFMELIFFWTIFVFKKSFYFFGDKPSWKNYKIIRTIVICGGLLKLNFCTIIEREKGMFFKSFINDIFQQKYSLINTWLWPMATS